MSPAKAYASTGRVLRALASKMAADRRHRDQLIRMMRDQGASQTTIAKAAGISHTTVATICRQGES